MRKIIYFLVLTVLLVSCELKEIGFEGVESYQMEKFENNEIHLLLKLKVKNENWFNLKVKPSQLNVSANGKKIGTAFLDKKVKIKGKSNQAYETKIRFKLADGALFSLPGLMTQDDVNLVFEGKVKGKVFFFGKKVDIKESKTIHPKDFNLNLFNP